MTCIAKNLNLRMEDARVVLDKINEMRQLMNSYTADQSKQSMLNYKRGAIYNIAMSILQYFPVVRGANPNKVGLNSDSYRLPNGTLRVDKKKLGEGTFGVVYAGLMTNDKHKIPIAVKYPLVNLCEDESKTSCIKREGCTWKEDDNKDYEDEDEDDDGECVQTGFVKASKKNIKTFNQSKSAFVLETLLHVILSCAYDADTSIVPRPLFLARVEPRYRTRRLAREMKVISEFKEIDHYWDGILAYGWMENDGNRFTKGDCVFHDAGVPFGAHCKSKGYTVHSQRLPPGKHHVQKEWWKTHKTLQRYDDSPQIQMALH